MRLELQEGAPVIKYIVESSEPFEMTEFVNSMTGLSKAFSRYIGQEHPKLVDESSIFILEMRPGSIITELAPYFAWAQPFVAEALAEHVVGRFLKWLESKAEGIIAKEVSDKRDIGPVSQLLDIVANHPDACTRLVSAVVKDGKTQDQAVLKFDSTQAREIRTRARELLEQNNEAVEIRKRVLMQFVRVDQRDVEPGKRSGEQVIIREIYEKPRPIIYETELAEKRMKTEIREAEENLFKKGFVVDVIVVKKNEKPLVYKIFDVHNVIDLPDDE